jgi:hypothetical protein
MVRVGTWTLVLLLWLTGSPASAMDDNESSRRSLKGLRGVSVMTTSVRPEFERDGLSRSTIQTDAELKLRQAGIAVVPAASGGAMLYVRVNAIQSDKVPGVYAFSVDVQFIQVGALVRDQEVPGLMVTWSTSPVIAMVGGARFAASIRDEVRDQVDGFVNAYLAANPKR